MEFQKFAKEVKRMCKLYSCNGCPLNKLRVGIFCFSQIMDQPKEAEEIVEKWAAEHPFMTNGKKFREVFGTEMTQNPDFRIEDWLNEEYKPPKGE